MKPAASLIAFTTLSGAGFGLIAWLALGFGVAHGMLALPHWALGFALICGGLLSSVGHLARPARARFAFSQWRSSWLSREGVLSLVTLLASTPLALTSILTAFQSLAIGFVIALLAAATVGSTAMIYAQLRAIPRWNMALTPVLFLAQAAAGGALLAGQGRAAAVLLAVLTLVQLAVWHRGDRRFAEVGQNLGTATTLGPEPRLALFERSHTAHDWVMDEMAFRVARKHSSRLRQIGLVLIGPLPAALAALAPANALALGLAAVVHLVGGFICRWLFFAEAEHVVGLYYGT